MGPRLQAGCLSCSPLLKHLQSQVARVLGFTPPEESCLPQQRALHQLRRKVVLPERGRAAKLIPVPTSDFRSRGILCLQLISEG